MRQKLQVLVFVLLLISTSINFIAFKEIKQAFYTDYAALKDKFVHYESVQDIPVVYRAIYSELNLIEHDEKSTQAVDLPDELIIPAGDYRIGSDVYDFSQEGIYRSFVPGGQNIQRIVYTGDIRKLLSSISWIITHGNRDNSLSFEEMSQKAKSDKVYLTCTQASKWVAYLLEGKARTRIVAGLTKESFNSYNNGHTMFEVLDEARGKWICIDIDNNNCFSYNGIPLSFIELSQRVASDDYDIVPLSSDTAVDISGFKDKTSGYNYNFFAEQISASIREWYKRVLDVPLVGDGEFYYFCDVSQKERIYSTYKGKFKYLAPTDFYKRFYPSIGSNGLQK